MEIILRFKDFDIIYLIKKKISFICYVKFKFIYFYIYIYIYIYIYNM